MIGAVKGERDFSTDCHIQAFNGERQGGKKYQDSTNDAKLPWIVSDQSAFEKRLFLNAKNMGVFMSVRGATVTGIVFTTT